MLLTRIDTRNMRRVLLAAVLAFAAIGFTIGRCTAQDPTGAPRRAAIGSVTAEPVGTQRAQHGKPKLLDFPELSEAREIRTTYPGGGWHWRRGVRRDNMGDGQLGIAVIGDRKVYMLMMRMGTPPSGGAFWSKPYDGNIYEGWKQLDPSEDYWERHPIKSIPHLPNTRSHWVNDTHHWAQNPETGVFTFGHAQKPGWNWPQVGFGETFAPGRATALNPGVEPSTYTRFPFDMMVAPHEAAPWEGPFTKSPGQFWGGTAEAAIFYDPFIRRMVYFYTGKTREPPDIFGDRHRSRIGRMFAPVEGFDTEPQWERDPPAGPESYVFEPVRDGANGEYVTTNEGSLWGTKQTILQQSVNINEADGVYHLTANGKRPFRRANGEPANGKSNATVGLGHWYSLKQGAPGSWVADKRNPLVTWASLGWEPNGFANRINSSHTLFDHAAGKGYFLFWGNPTGEQNKLGTRLLCMEFDL